MIANEVGLVEADIAKLYDDWFIETCDEWVVPYIGDLIGARNLHPVSAQTFSRRAWVANTLGYRRRKGTATMLEQLARDATGWPAHAVEFFERLAWTQYMNHVRLHAPATASLRSPNALELRQCARSIRSRTRWTCASIERGRGRHNIPNVGLFLWRLAELSDRRQRRDGGEACPPISGRRAPTRTAATGVTRSARSGSTARSSTTRRARTRSRRWQASATSRAPCAGARCTTSSKRLRQALVDGDPPPPPVYFDGDRAVLRVVTRMTAGGALAEIAPEFIGICNLADPPPPALPPADWRRPVDKTYVKRQTGAVVTRDGQRCGRSPRADASRSPPA